jgi:hypothetical protein
VLQRIPTQEHLQANEAATKIAIDCQKHSLGIFKNVNDSAYVLQVFS